MRLSLLISILIHAVLLWALLTLFRIVPEMRLPEKVYQVKILQPIIRSLPVEQQVKVESPPEPEPEKPAEVKPKEKAQAPEKKQEQKPPPQPEQQPMDLSVAKDVEDGTSIAIEGQRFPFSYYLAAVERKVSENWYSAVSSGAEGYACTVFFRLRRDGRVTDVQIEQSSGNAYYDRSAMRAIRSATPFPPLPKAFTDDYLGIHFTFVQRD
jgi:TonB family protein